MTRTAGPWCLRSSLPPPPTLYAPAEKASCATPQPTYSDQENSVPAGLLPAVLSPRRARREPLAVRESSTAAANVDDMAWLAQPDESPVPSLGLRRGPEYVAPHLRPRRVGKGNEVVVYEPPALAGPGPMVLRSESHRISYVLPVLPSNRAACTNQPPSSTTAPRRRKPRKRKTAWPKASEMKAIPGFDDVDNLLTTAVEGLANDTTDLRPARDDHWRPNPETWPVHAHSTATEWEQRIARWRDGQPLECTQSGSVSLSANSFREGKELAPRYWVDAPSEPWKATQRKEPGHGVRWMRPRKTPPRLCLGGIDMKTKRLPTAMGLRRCFFALCRFLTHESTRKRTAGLVCL
ncbi:hypothetical protein J4E83_006321 [Alternaria metachromatica]|uniref:uncharacterized protein n=1 Tax=Alternaria metachromatica TaxID=283354 RepID=UPI0020C33E39|nr:uncharacterized protein J4E83_006321 [Alternaria metachromatica]KAI4617988.1 hypothetical protein J4E83_006321 [Alternaria metachromatica]